jgi:AmiR/NasT family two-component response regulator
MWKPQALPRLRATIFEPVTTARMLATEMLNRMAITGVQTIQNEDEVSVFNPAFAVDILVLEHSMAAEGHARAMQVFEAYTAIYGTSACLIFTSNDARESNIREAIARGCDALIMRPYSPRSFCDRVKWAIERKAARASQFVIAA